MINIWYSDHGADASLCDADGRNALHKAAEGGKSETVKVLLERTNVDPTSSSHPINLIKAKDARGRTALDLLPSHSQQLRYLFVHLS